MKWIRSLLRVMTGCAAIAGTIGLASGASIGISALAYSEVNARTSQDQSQFYVYQDVDSGFNHGFPSGLFGSAMSKLAIDPGCVYSSVAVDGCSTDPTAVDPVRGTVFRFTFSPLLPSENVGRNFEEPENWSVIRTGTGYDLTGATTLVFDAVSPTGGIQVQFNVNGFSSPFMSIAQQWTTYSIDLSSLGIFAQNDVHVLFGMQCDCQGGPSGCHGANGGTVLLDNIHFLQVPASETKMLGFPLSSQVVGVVHVPGMLPGSIPIPPDQINAGLSTVYESALTVLAQMRRGQPQDFTNAKLIADSLVYALAHENQGEPLPTAPGGETGLHNGMANGDLALFNGQGVNSGQQGQIRLAGFTASVLCPPSNFCLVLDGATGGNNAFAMLALLAAYAQFQDPNYLNAARTIGNWIYGTLLDSSDTGYGGYFVGYPDEGHLKILETSKSTENNADIFAAFSAQASIESALGNPGTASLWTARANIAGDFVMQMFDPSGHFFGGTVPPIVGPGPGIYPNGARTGNDIINTFDFLDSQTFTTLAMASASRYRNQIDWRLPVQWILDHFALTVTANNLTFQGFDLIEAVEHQNTDGPAGVAWEFTAQTVATMKLADSLYGTSQFANSISTYLNQIRQAQTGAPYADGSGIVAATLPNGFALPPYQQCSVTPFQCIAERTGLAATTWAIAADEGLNFLDISPTGHTGGGKIGIYRNGTWVLDSNGNEGYDSSDATYSYGGLPGDIPVVGDWNGDGRTKIGIYRNGTWILDTNGNGHWDPSDGTYIYGGLAGDVPVVGDWNGDGRTKIGIYRNGTWILDTDGNGAWDSSDGTYVYGGLPGDVPMVGDWIGDGISRMGIYRYGAWILDSDGNNTYDSGDVYTIYGGLTGDIPVVGKWTGGPRSLIGIYRGGTWVLDSSGNGGWDPGDLTTIYGGLGPDLPVVGQW